MVHRFKPSTWAAEAGGSHCLRPAWFRERFLGQPGLHGETLSQKRKTKIKKKEKKISLEMMFIIFCCLLVFWFLVLFPVSFPCVIVL